MYTNQFLFFTPGFEPQTSGSPALGHPVPPVWCFISWKAPEDRCYYRDKIFSLKFTKYQDQLGELKHSPEPLAAIREFTSKEGEGKRREGEEGEEKGKRKGDWCPPRDLFARRPRVISATGIY